MSAYAAQLGRQDGAVRSGTCPKRSSDRAPGEVADRGNLEPRPGGRLSALVAARQAAPAPELGERVLDPVERPDRNEDARTRWRRLDVER
jgi:hypothetical protein